MTPDEKQLLTGLFDRIGAAETGPRDLEADNFINMAIRQNPGAAYLLAQTVLIQEQALAAANQKLQELQSAGQGGGSFLGGIGKSLFGQTAPQPSRTPQPAYPSQNYPSAPGPASPGPAASGPWGAAAPSSGGFLSGALHTAAGVAGGMLLADGIRSLFGGNHGMMSNIAGPAFGGMSGNDISNNYAGDSQSQNAADVQQDQDQDQDDAQDAADDSADDSGTDDSSNA